MCVRSKWAPPGGQPPRETSGANVGRPFWTPQGPGCGEGARTPSLPPPPPSVLAPLFCLKRGSREGRDGGEGPACLGPGAAPPTPSTEVGWMGCGGLDLAPAPQRPAGREGRGASASEQPPRAEQTLRTETVCEQAGWGGVEETSRVPWGQLQDSCHFYNLRKRLRRSREGCNLDPLRRCRQCSPRRAPSPSCVPRRVEQALCQRPQEISGALQGPPCSGLALPPPTSRRFPPPPLSGVWGGRRQEGAPLVSPQP